MRRWFVAMRATARIARRDAVRSRGRTALVVAMVGLPVLVASGGAVLVQSSIPTLSSEAHERLGPTAQAWITSDYPGEPIIQDAYGFQSMPLRAIESEGGAVSESTVHPSRDSMSSSVSALLPEGDRLAEVSMTDSRVESSTASVGTAVKSVESGEAEYTSRAELASGAWPTAVGEALVGVDLAADLGVGVGDSLTIRTSSDRTDTVAITGLSTSQSGDRSVRVVVVKGSVPVGVDRPQGWFVLGDQPVTWADVVRLNSAGVNVTSRAVLADPPVTRPEVAPDATTITGATVALVAVAVAVGILEVVLLVGPAFAIGARRAARELALVAVAGGDRRDLRRVVLMRGVVVGLASSAIAATIGVVVGSVIVSIAHTRDSRGFPDLRVPWTAVAAFAAIGLLVAVAAAWIPSRRAGRLDVVAAVSGRRIEARPRRGATVLGLCLLLLGTASAAVGAVTARSALLVAGVVALQTGVVMSSGPLVTLAGRLAPRFGVAGRLALRDAARQRGRTAPAVAAVIAAVAGIVAGSTYLQSNEHANQAAYQPLAPVGTVIATVGEPGGIQLADDAAVAADVRSKISQRLVGSAVATVVVGIPRGGDGGWTELVVAPGQECPADRQIDDDRDPRCKAAESSGIFAAEVGTGGWIEPTVLVDDGSAAKILGQPASAIAALRSGKAVVTDRRVLRDDGTVSVVSHVGEKSVESALPAVLGRTYGQFTLLVPPTLADRIEVDPTVAGFVARSSAGS